MAIWNPPSALDFYRVVDYLHRLIDSGGIAYDTLRVAFKDGFHITALTQLPSLRAAPNPADAESPHEAGTESLISCLKDVDRRTG